MLYGKYNFHCQLDSEANLPYFKGSTFRGVFGRALKKVVCALKLQECSDCLLKHKCLYSQVFETIEVTRPVNLKMSAPPHPFVIEPPLIEETKFPEGASFDFNLLLFGEVNSSLPYFIYAFDQMGKIGIGRRTNGKRGAFSLNKVLCEKELIYSNTDKVLKTGKEVCSLTLSKTKENSEKKLRVKLTLETPLRIKYENKLKAELPFHIIVRAMLRRISSLLNYYDSGEPDLDYKGLVKRACDIRTASSNLRWFDWKRYSFRQDQEMLMGGIAGTVTYEGTMEEYLTLLDFCSKVHLGKQTTFGLGKIKAEVV